MAIVLLPGMDPSFDRDRHEMTINNWWWEKDIQVSDEMQSALVSCFQEFARYLAADRVVPGAKAKRKPSMDWVQSAQISA